DTSDSYGLGRAERILGSALAARRGQAVIATKAGWVPDGSERWMKDLSADHLRAAAQRSRERLGVDRLDVFQLHAVPEEGAETAAALDALDELKAQGVVRLAGASVGADFEAGRRLVKSGRIDVLQVHYNLLQQGSAAELLDEAEAGGVGVIASLPLAHGFLAGGYTRATRFARSDWRSRLTPEEISARVERVDELRFLRRGARSLAQAALQFVLAHPAVSTTIPGFRNEEQVEDLVGSLAVPALSDIEVARARELGREWSRPVPADA
ncbi:MAG: aldo/keto reductase, partial [bacterium]